MAQHSEQSGFKSSGGAPLILVVDDGPAEREALARVLRLEGYQVLTARNPDHALTMLDQPISLVISDLKMGTLSGIYLLRAWQGRRPETPFIIVTAYGNVDSEAEAREQGAYDFLRKPINPTHLLKLVNRCLESVLEPPQDD